MPQLIPFFFVNQVTFVFILTSIILYLFSKYILPEFMSMFSTRLYLIKL